MKCEKYVIDEALEVLNIDVSAGDLVVNEAHEYVSIWGRQSAPHGRACVLQIISCCKFECAMSEDVC